jgi:ribonuclease T2
MMKIPAALVVGTLLSLSCSRTPPPQTSSRYTPPGFTPPGSPASRTSGVQTGSAAFDYYLLNLSWAPEFCHSKPDNPECSGNFGFIVHGLWPQNSAGGYPSNCGNQPGPTDPSSLLDIMPDLHLIQHEWTTHGTCTGLAADDYFALIRRVRASLKIPPDFVAPQQQLTVRPADLKREFEQANPGVTDSGIAVSCGGPYLVAVEICFTKDGKPAQCGGDIRDCNKPSIRVPKVQ